MREGRYAQTIVGTVPVSVIEFKDWARIPQSITADDALIETLLGTATVFGERYTRRDFRSNGYTVTLDTFPTNIELRRDPVASITSVTYTLDSVVTTVDSDTYYLTKGVQRSFVVLYDGQVWPEDGDEVTANLLDSIVVTFKTEAFNDNTDDSVANAILAHANRMYSERGDCPTLDAARESGALDIYDTMKVSVF